MKTEDVLSNQPKILSADQRHFYFENGYLLVESIVSDEWIARLNKTTDEMLEKSRQISESDDIFDLEPDHTTENPRLRRRIPRAPCSTITRPRRPCARPRAARGRRTPIGRGKG